MPLHWTIDSKERLFSAAAEGDVTKAEFEAYLDTIDDADLHTWRKLFDGLHAHTTMGMENIMALGVRMRASHQKSAVGALAIVAQEEMVPMFTRVLGMLAAANRPLRVFSDVGTAREWILKQPL
jgi:hypothetical protein